MAASQPAGINNIPEEIWGQVIRSIPVTDLPNLVLSSRAFYRQANRHLYRSVYYIVGSIPLTQYNFALLRSDTRSYDPKYSAKIVRPHEFLRTIIESPVLRSHIDEASFSIQGTSDKGETEALKECLSILTLSTLHLALANNNANLALASSITSLDIMYPAEEELEDLHDSLRDQIYSLFNIPSLRHLYLRSARSWCAFSPIPDSTRVRTSNVVSLSLPNTVPMDTDLQEILTWPKALKCIYHENIPGDDNFFQNGGHGKIASPERFLQGIASQRESLEEVSYDNAYDCCGTDESTFTPAIMSEFLKLKHLSVNWDCLLDETWEQRPLYTVLPPNLKELYLEQGYIGDAEYEAQLREWLQEVVEHKEYFPSLKTVVLWKWEDRARYDDYRPEAQAVLERLYVLHLSQTPPALDPE
jgi:hypothetical protein